MSDLHDDEIETLLRRNFDGPVPDAGFSGKLMQRLPPRRRRTAWPLWGGILAGIGACGWSLLRSPLLGDGLHDWLRGEWSMPAVALLLTAAGMSLLTCWWGATEADAR
ncbi:hypothetical protein [Rhodanobacter sp. DHB23]|uniref:hypothetical protein n=1 Tax=Rhodanobacter sp. DHB23 TaxID=2775923 RepID=UPI00177A9D13|nr:hypothetical protein [Rhodanobacter sp. DHB23]MBD8872891.1 hypothetical protein [Rhodanobacter sp. DHB23]